MSVPGAENEQELDITMKVDVRRIVLRNFDYRLAPLGFEYVAVRPGVFVRREPADGLELVAHARDASGLEVALRFDRSEFVNVATAGLAMLDAADAATEQDAGGGEI